MNIADKLSEEEYKKGFGPFGAGFLTADYCNNNCDCKQACTTSIESIKSLITKNNKRHLCLSK